MCFAYFVKQNSLGVSKGISCLEKNRNHCRHPMMQCWCYNTGTVITPQNDTNHSDWCHYSFGVIRLNRHNSLKDVHYRRRRLGLKDPNLKNEKVLPLQNDCRWSKGRSKRGRGWLTDKSNCSHLPCYFSSWLYPKLTATTTTPLPKQNAVWTPIYNLFQGFLLQARY